MFDTLGFAFLFTYLVGITWYAISGKHKERNPIFFGMVLTGSIFVMFMFLYTIVQTYR